MFLKKEHPDGFISLDEFVNIFKQLYKYGDAEKYAKIAFKAFDHEKKGKITFAEFLIASSFAINTNSRADLKGSLEFIFDIYDADKNGMIDKKEMEKLIEALYESEGDDTINARKRVTEIFKYYDLDKNKSLDKNEFMAFMTLDQVASKIFKPQI